MSRLHEEMMRVLIGDIVAGRAPEGSMLPREADLAEQFGVSRGVARECVRSLEERGLVSVTHGRGAKVTDSEHWNTFDADVLAGLLRGGDGTRRVLEEYLECRRLLEIEAAGLAAERARAGDIELLTDAFERMTAAAERARVNPAAEDIYHEADIAFHRAVMSATGNRALRRATEPVHRALVARRLFARPQFRFERSLPEHRRILTAIADHDADRARAAMRDHLLTVEGYVSEYLDQIADGAPDGRSRRRASARA